MDDRLVHLPLNLPPKAPDRKCERLDRESERFEEVSESADSTISSHVSRIVV